MTTTPNTDSEPAPSAEGGYGGLPASIWVLGLGSMLMDTSSELIHSVLPVFMTASLGASMVTIGAVEGVAEAAAAVTKAFSGVASDFFGRRKWLVVTGYGLSALSKPLFALATTVGWVFGARFLDRIGKGIRGGPRDALVADLALPRLRGAAFGLRQSLDSVGAFLGPLLAVVFTVLWADDIRTVLWVATVPAFLTVLLLAVGVREPAPGRRAGDAGRRLTFRDVGRLPAAYWRVMVLGAVFGFARFSEAFLILRARDVGVAVAYVPATLIVMNVFYAILAYPAGAVADRLPSRKLLVLGLGLLVAADIALAAAAAPSVVLAGAALWGAHMAFTQGLLAKLVADTAPAEARGTAFGVFQLVSGGAHLVASVLAGSLWSLYGAPAAFAAGAAFAALAALGAIFFAPDRPVRV